MIRARACRTLVSFEECGRSMSAASDGAEVHVGMGEGGQCTGDAVYSEGAKGSNESG